MVKHQFFIVLLLCTVFLLGYRAAPNTPNDAEQYTLQVRWCKAYPAEQWLNIRQGIAWTLSYLGATLPKNAIYRTIKSTEDPSIVELNFAQAGFSPTALHALKTILDSLKRTAEYDRFCSIDLGRLVVLTVHSPHHYYRITGMPRSLASFRSLHEMDKGVLQFPVVRSSIATGNRIVEFKTGKQPTQWAFVAAEGHGRMELDNFVATEYEVFDIMPNGQLRFAIYDRNGALHTATPLEMGEAGKPGNCLWCHESSLQTLFTPTFNVPGALSVSAFRDTIKTLKKNLLQYQKAQKSDIDFDSVYQHTQHELLYITFMEPSAERIANEWNMPIKKVQQYLARLPQHRNEEFPWMGLLYHRRDIDPLAPIKQVRIPSSVRAPSDFEPDFFK